MKKKVDVDDLRVGMYVSALDRNWLDTPFLFQGFEIQSAEEIEELKRHCRHVYVDTAPAATARAARPARGTSASGFDVLARFAPGRRQPPRYTDQTNLHEELAPSREIERETRTVVYTIMEDARMGRAIPTAAAKKVVADMVASVIRNPDALIYLNQLKNKDEYTALHSLRVCVLALAFGRHLGFSPEELNVLGIGALLHDIGKMKVPNDILNKPGQLTEAEFALMRSHVPHGVEILEGTKGVPAAAIAVARLHHERYNGEGYARGERGEHIGLYGSIGAIVDCYDAITSDRAYHRGISAHEALKKMYTWRGHDFHPALVEQFIQCMGIYPIGSVVELNNGSLGVVVSINRRRRLRPKVMLVLNEDKVPYQPAKVIDLTAPEASTTGSVIEIRRVLDAENYGINPADYVALGA